MRKTAKPKNTTERSISMAELLCLGMESTNGAERERKGKNKSDYDNTFIHELLKDLIWQRIDLNLLQM